MDKSPTNLFNKSIDIHHIMISMPGVKLINGKTIKPQAQKPKYNLKTNPKDQSNIYLRCKICSSFRQFMNKCPDGDNFQNVYLTDASDTHSSYQKDDQVILLTEGNNDLKVVTQEENVALH